MDQLGSTLFWLVLSFAAVSAVIVALVLLGERSERRAREGLKMSISSLGLVDDTSAVATGWKSLARGTWRGVPLAVGERVHSYMSSQGPRQLMGLVINSKARGMLGRYQILQHFLHGIHTQSTMRTGDQRFDGQFRLTAAGSENSPPPLDPFHPSEAPSPPSWLNERTRQLMLAASLLQMVEVWDDRVTVVIRWYDKQTFQIAIDLALHLAQWPGGSEQSYR